MMTDADPASPSKPSDTSPGTVAGAAAFVAGAVGTIVAAIGSFGSDDSALAAARRNHVWWLVAAASAAALGLMLAGLYALAMGEGKRHAGTPTAEGGKTVGATGGWWARFRRWVPANGARLILAAAVVAVALGVGLGAYATTDRRPGVPAINVDAIGNGSVRVEITAEGLPSSDWYEALVVGERESGDPDAMLLGAGRFSPAQNGRVDWKMVMDFPTS
jgi:hypothetical protein